jgi:hypothetical protein
VGSESVPRTESTETPRVPHLLPMGLAVDRLLVLRNTRGDVTVVEVPPGSIALREAGAAVVQRRGLSPHMPSAHSSLSDPTHRVDSQYPVVYVPRSVPADVGFLRSPVRITSLKRRISTDDGSPSRVAAEYECEVDDTSPGAQCLREASM